MTLNAMQTSDGTGQLMLASARVAFGIFFVGSAILKYFAAGTEMEMMRMAGFANPLPLYVIAALAQVAGGVALIFNRLTRSAALGLMLYVAVINYFMHPFWTLSGDAWSIQFQLFTKNLGIMAGLAAVGGAAGTWAFARRPLL
jgi:putative oxidoreductase